MPTYRYRCGTCGEDFEVWQSMKDPSLTVHRDSVPDSDCDGTLVKVLSPAGIVLKGSGFYKNDSRSSNGSRSGGSRQDKRDDKRDKDSSSSSSDSGSKRGESLKPSGRGRFGKRDYSFTRDG